METIIDTALAQSILAGLSISLIFYILKQQALRDAKQDERELRYQKIISDLTTELYTLESIKNDLKALCERL